ncbi:MAG: ABC transporter ATP-binding protein [Pseudomonadota bacterium]
MPAVEFRNIYKQFGRVPVLEDLNLHVEDGAFLVLLGPSGCGKTTLLNLLAGLHEVSSGTILIDDRDITDLEPKDRGLAMVFQSYALYPTKTVRGNLRFGLAASKLNRAEMQERIDWAAKMLQIEPLLDRKPAQLSGGQRQRVAIGRALVKKVGLFLFDEPLSNLDAKLRVEMRLEIKKLHEELRSTVVYVTHDQIEAMTMASKIAVMDGGVIQQIGTPDEIYEVPVNLFVARFIGAPAMNMLEATLAVSGRDVIARNEEVGVEFGLTDYPFAVLPRDGMTTIVGMRPEHFSMNGVGPMEPAVTFRLPVQYSERTGSDATAFLKCRDDHMAIRVSPEEVKSMPQGALVEARFPTSKVNLFDARNGQRM